MSDWPHRVSKKDLLIEPVKGSGSGGQKRNKTCSGIRMTHIPTGISVRCDEERMQSQNLKLAFKRLADKLIPLMKNEEMKSRYLAGEKRVRTYNKKNNRVTDERIPGKIFSYDEVLEGDGFDKIIEELQKVR